MRDFGLSFGRRVRAALIGSSFAVVLATASLAAPALAADQPTTTAATPDAIGPHTHQVHGIVKGTPASGATSFVVTTERYGDVTVTFAGANDARGRGHAHGHARSFELTSAGALKDGDRVVVQGRTSQDGKTFIGRRVHVLPAEGAVAHPTHVVGTIAAVSTSNGNTTLMITPTNGNASQSVTLTSDARIRPDGKTLADLKVGTKVTVVSKNGTTTGVVIVAA
jgi:fructose-specific component phosphotransferase system IIB-like protein